MEANIPIWKIDLTFLQAKLINKSQSENFPICKRPYLRFCQDLAQYHANWVENTLFRVHNWISVVVSSPDTKDNGPSGGYSNVGTSKKVCVFVLSLSISCDFRGSKKYLSHLKHFKWNCFIDLVLRSWKMQGQSMKVWFTSADCFLKVFVTKIELR